jgi:hypothetical protein
MNRIGGYRMLAIALAFSCGAALGAVQSFAGKAEDKSASVSGRIGKTVFMDVSALGRRGKAAKRMTELHLEHARQGWTVQDVTIYTENGDLEGFFLTYLKE